MAEYFVALTEVGKDYEEYIMNFSRMKKEPFVLNYLKMSLDLILKRNQGNTNKGKEISI